MTGIDEATLTTESAQLVLDLSPTVTPIYAKHMSIEERFALFHAANPMVAEDLEVMARQWFAAGQTKTGVKALYEQLRWQAGIRTVGDKYKLNNDFTRPYAHLLIARNPEWSTRIDTRESPRPRTGRAAA